MITTPTIHTKSAIFALFIVLFYLFYCLDSTDGEDMQKIFTPDYTYLNQTNSLYKLHSKALNFTDARTKCESEGASLWYPEDLAEVEAVVPIWKDGNDILFIGITDLEFQGCYQTIDGRPIYDVFNNWEEGQPDNGRGVEGEERCLVIRQKSLGFVLNDHRCSNKFPFICKKNLKHLECTKKAEAVKSGEANNQFSPKGYTYLKKFNSFYKVHTKHKNYRDAGETCEMEGASFWYPENQLEADEVIAFWNQMQPKCRWVYIAVTYLKTKGVFETNDGHSLDDVFEWGLGQPDGPEEQHCGILRREGVLNYNRCDRPFPFICKISLDSLNCSNTGQTHTHMTTNNYYPKDYTYIADMKSFYKIHTIQRNVTDAEIQCKKEGATFWYPKHKAEANAVIALWKQVQPQFSWVYIAVNDLKTKGVFQTFDGCSLDDVYNKWGPGEPNHGGTKLPEERCVILRQEGDLNVHLCDKRFPFVCEKSLGSTCNYKCDLPNHGSQITETFFRRDYTYLDKTKSLYKIHTIQRDVFEADKRCKSEGATFWYPENRAEVDAVTAFWAANQPTVIWVHVAISDLKTKGTYLTNDGRPIEDVYNAWDDGEPNNGDGYYPEERCIVLKNEGVYNDDQCDRNYTFICKKTLDSFCTDQCNNPQEGSNVTSLTSFGCHISSCVATDGCTTLPEQQLQQVMHHLNMLLDNDTVTVGTINEDFAKVNDLLRPNGTVKIPGQLPHIIGEIGSRMDLNGSHSATAVRDNIALYVADVEPDQRVRGIKIAARDDGVFTNDTFQILTEEVEFTRLTTNDTEAAVHLPESVSTSNRRTRISSVVFSNDRAFTSNDRAFTSNDRAFTSVERLAGVTLNSRVISIRVENLTHIEQGEYIDIHLSPIVKQTDRNVCRTCAYRSFLEDGTGFWSTDGCTLIKSPEEGILDICRCDHFTHHHYFAELLVTKSVFSESNEQALEVLSVIGCCLSIFGLVMIGLTAALFRSWRQDYSNKIWLQLCVAIFSVMICFLIVVFAKFDCDHYNVACMLVGVALHYSVLASFCWMLVAAVLSYRRLVLVFTKDASHKLLRASAFSWGAPCAVVGILLSVAPHAFEGRFDEKTPTAGFCYPSGLSLWLSLYAPVALILLANWTLFALIVRSLFASRSIQRHGDSKEALRCASVSCLLVFLFGLPWIFGLFANNIVAAYMFTLTATYQGFVLFLFLVVRNMKTRDLWLNKLKIKQTRKVPVTPLVNTNRSTDQGDRGRIAGVRAQTVPRVRVMY